MEKNNDVYLGGFGRTLVGGVAVAVAALVFSTALRRPLDEAENAHVTADNAVRMLSDQAERVSENARQIAVLGDRVERSQEVVQRFRDSLAKGGRFTAEEWTIEKERIQTELRHLHEEIGELQRQLTICVEKHRE